MTCWLCGGKRPGCACTGERIDTAIGGRPSSSGVRLSDALIGLDTEGLEPEPEWDEVEIWRHGMVELSERTVELLRRMTDRTERATSAVKRFGETLQAEILGGDGE